MQLATPSGSKAGSLANSPSTLHPAGGLLANSRRLARLLGLLLATVAFSILTPGHASAGTPRRPVAASDLFAQVTAGKAVFAKRVRVEGTLVLPAEVRAPFVVRNSVFANALIGSSSSFRSLVDLSNSKFTGGLDLRYARFDGALILSGAVTAKAAPTSASFAVFEGPIVAEEANFAGAVSFAGAEFHGASRFQRSVFERKADFAFTDFDHVADFLAASFSGPASFSGVEFHSIADFSSGEFDDNAAFNATRFFGLADFTAATFSTSTPGPGGASFAAAHYDGGANFLHAFFAQGATFDRATALSDMDFEGVSFEGDAIFSTVRFLADADFSAGDFARTVDFDQAELSKLNLDGASIPRGPLVLPDPNLGTGHVSDLRMDPADIVRVRSGDNRETRAARLQAFTLVEKASRAGGDLRAAAEAGVRRLTLTRRGRPPVLREADWLVAWGIFGYLFRPLHPLLVLVALFAFGSVFRWHRRRSRGERVPGFTKDLGTTFNSLWGLSPGQATGWDRAEALAFKALLAALLISATNRWPPASDLLKGILP